MFNKTIRIIVPLLIACLILVSGLFFISPHHHQYYSDLVFSKFSTTSGQRKNSTADLVDHKTNIVAIYAGRWQFLRILLPYLHRDLQVNGGVIDEVWFMIVRCSDDDMKRLTSFTETANNILNKKVFSIHPKSPDFDGEHRFVWPSFEIMPRMNSDPNINFFKFDDDIVYIHPEAFSNIITQNDPDCLMYFFNIAGSHWRLNWIYQTELGLYKDPHLNPKNLSFEYNFQAWCGWISPDCNEMGLRTFLYHYNNNSLDKLLFNRLEHLTDKKQFSFNAVLFKHDMIDLIAMVKSKPIGRTLQDEEYWTVEYTSHSKRANCIVGNALVVHFSYQKTVQYMLEKTHLLEDFHSLIRNNRKQFKMDLTLWKLLEIYD